MQTKMSGVRFVLFPIGLPLLFVAPEVINLGVLFLRWEYLLFLYLAVSYALSPTRPARIESLHWNQRTTLIVFLYIISSILMMLRSGIGFDSLDGIKYASWPIKTVLWAAGAWFSLRLLNGTAKTVYRMLSVLVVLVVTMQFLELTLPAFRDWLFTYYPVAAEERLRELDYRARGPFNGYDATSIFFAAACVYFNEFGRQFPVGKTNSTWRIFLSLIGAFISARTGFLLAILYLLSSKFIYGRLLSKVIWGFSAFVAVLFLPEGTNTLSGEDTSLLGRNLEVVSALLKGNLLEVQSFYGTFDMNAVLMFAKMDRFWGNGLSVSTTADQLYFKYYFMFGQVGLAIWIAIHVSYLVVCQIGPSFTNEQRIFKNTSVAIILIIALAHVKGGNYFFASRLGEIIALFLILATVGRRTNNDGKKYDV